jgi:hypothetical protein
MFTKSDGRRLLQDSPIEEARREADEKRAKSHRAKLADKHYEEEQKLKSENIASEKRLEDQHRVRRDKIKTMHGGAGSSDPFRMGARHHEDGEEMKREMSDLKAHNRAKMDQLRDRQAREMSRARD